MLRIHRPARSSIHTPPTHPPTQQNRPPTSAGGSGAEGTPNPSSGGSGVRKRLQYTRSSSASSSLASASSKVERGGAFSRGGSRSSSSGSLEQEDVELEEIAVLAERRGVSGGVIRGGAAGLGEEGAGGGVGGGILVPGEFLGVLCLFGGMGVEVGG